jgi:hypothetical protein
MNRSRKSKAAEIVPRLAAVFLAMLSVSAFTQTSSPANGPWAGWVQCEISAENQGYKRHELQTWKLTSSTPIGLNGAIMHRYAATWEATGEGSINRIDGQRTVTGEWILHVSPQSAEFVIWVRPDGKLVISQWGLRQHEDHAVTGKRRLSINGTPQPATDINHATWEWGFRALVDSPANTHVSGSTETETEGANAELMPQFAPQHNATCKWDFARGNNATVPPPPGDTAGVSPPTGGSGSTTNPDHTPPTAIIDAPGQVDQSQRVTFSGARSSDVGGQIKEYRWTVGLDLNPAPGTITTIAPSLAYPQPGGTPLPAGSHQLQLVVVDDSGNVSSPAIATIIVNSTGPFLSSTLFTPFTTINPVVTQVTPNNGSQGATNLSVTVTGSATHFVQGTTKVDFGPGINATVRVSSATSATAALSIDPSAVAGLRTLTIKTDNEVVTLQDGFTVAAIDPLSTATITPAPVLPKFQPRGQDFVVGSSPRGIAFDGTNIWVASLDRTVTKVRASDGTKLGSFPTGVGSIGVAFDGSNIWVVNAGAKTVSKIRASDGTNLGTFTPCLPGEQPEGSIIFAAAYLWISCPTSLIRLRPSDGVNMGMFTGGGGKLQAFDGTNILATSHSTQRVAERRATDGALGYLDTIHYSPQFTDPNAPDYWDNDAIPYNSQAEGIAFDGANIWVSVYTVNGKNFVCKRRASDGAWLGEFPVGSQASAVGFDGTNIWVANSLDNTVTKLRASDGANLGTFGTGNFPSSIVFDGTHIWVTNSSSNTVSRF